MTRPHERHHAEVLAGYLSIAHGFELTVSDASEPVDSPVDARATDVKTGIELQFQSVGYRADNVYAKKVTANVPGRFRAALGSQMSRGRRIATLREMLKKKRDHYSLAVRSQLILIVEVTIPSVFPDEIEALRGGDDYGFKGIYFVQLPLMYGNGGRRDLNGYVIPLVPLNLPIVADAAPHVAAIGHRVMGPVFAKIFTEQYIKGNRPG